MSDFEIARNFGATAFLVYHVIKASPNLSTRDIVMETGMDTGSIQRATKTLVDLGLVKNEKKILQGCRIKNHFSLNENILH